MLQDSHPHLNLLAHLRHELRTPINAIMGYSEMLLEELEEIESEAQRELLLVEQLQKIQAFGTQLLALVNTLLSPTKLENRQAYLDTSALGDTLQAELHIPTQAIITHCQELLAQPTTDFTPDINKIHTAAERLLNMLGNMIELSEQQIVSTNNNQTLNLVKTENSKVSFSASNLPSPSFSENLIYQNPLPTDESGSGQDTILVVDDNETNRDLLSRQIKAQGYIVATAANGQQAIDMLQTGKYDLLLLDILMPEMNGYEVLQWLRHSSWRYIPVIMISALDEIDSVVKCIEMGAEDYLPKPFNSVLLRARVNACLEKKKLRDQETLYLDQLAQANQEITSLNQRLQAENFRLSAELEVTKRLQQMILPKETELKQIERLDIAGFMEPADEVGGDYYDVLQHNGRIKIGIGDVTGHGLESGVLMLMVQTAVRTLIESNETDLTNFLNTLNRIIYKNVQRMDSDKNLTFCLVDYKEGILSLSGQHEEIVVVRSGGEVERIDTIDLGFPLGLEETIADFVLQTQIKLNDGDVVVLYTDGITEAENDSGGQYGIERLCEIVSHNWQKSASEIRQIVIDDLLQYIGEHRIYDDITLLIFKQK